MSEEGGGKIRGVPDAADQSSRPPQPPLPQNYYYGTFQGVANYQPQRPPPDYSVIGIPQPVPPPSHYYPQGYQTVPGISFYLISINTWNI